jgi:hemoglobin
MRNVLALLLVSFAIGPASSAAAQTSAATHAPAKSLYQRLGGYDALAAVTDDFFARLAADPKLGRFFVGHSKDSLGRIRQLVVDQLCFVTGGPCVYIGRDMKTAHAGLGITKAEFDLSASHLAATLDKFKVPATEKAEVLTLVGTLEKDIVDAP